MALPEQYFIHANTYAPNNVFPVLVYRNVLPQPINEETASTFLQTHNWIKRGTWSHLPLRHFHPNTHECYGIFAGSSSFVIGRGQSDRSGGTIIYVKTGDVLVLPVGTGHASIESTEDYKYIGVYPIIANDELGRKRYRHDFGNTLPDFEALATSKRSAGIPSDPVFGTDGPLPRLWKERQGINEILAGLPEQKSDPPNW